MPAAVGFTVACSSATAPGEDAIGDFTFRLSLNYGGDTLYVDIPVHGKKDPKDEENGDDTKDVAESAAKAVQGSKDLSSAQKGKITVQEDGGGPGNTLGRIVIDDPTLKSVDAACDDKGKLQIHIIQWGDNPVGPKINLGELSPAKRKWKTKRKGAEPTEPPKSPGHGNTYERYRDPTRKWRDVQAMVFVGIDGATGAIGTGFELPYLDGLSGTPDYWALVGFDLVSESPVEQITEIERRLVRAGFDCGLSGGNLWVLGIRGRPDVSITGLGITFAMAPTSPGTGWETAIRISDEGRFCVNLRPSGLSVTPIPAAWFGGKLPVLTSLCHTPHVPGSADAFEPSTGVPARAVTPQVLGSELNTQLPVDGQAPTVLRVSTERD